ncbi:MAG: hypothetical protein IV100_00785 [Myxococcales bacterium]|nr:hypothetical protein [Myxococcales bacterium]
MAIARRYETFEVRGMLQGAEGVASPVTGAGAHSRGLHALKTPGGTGVNHSDMMYRTHKQVGESNNQFKNRGSAAQTSAFANLIQQADAACQGLNSPTGQAALGVLDDPTYSGRKLRVTLDVNNLKEIGFLGLGSGKMSTVSKTDMSVISTSAKGVRLIFDRDGGSTAIHIQTCFPLAILATPAYSVIDMTSKAVVANG